MPVLRKPVALVLFGSPGSGKGTQSKYIVEWLSIPQISTGDILRDLVRKGDSAIGERLRAGHLVSDELVNDLVGDRIGEEDCKNGFILDGYPRTTAQADEMMRLLASVGAGEVVIHLVVDYNVIISRITGRRVCPVCGTLYNAISHPPKVDGKCDLEGVELEVRDDDREEVVRERLEEYERQTQPLIEFFAKGGHRLYRVDASTKAPDDVFREIQKDLIQEGLVG